MKPGASLPLLISIPHGGLEVPPEVRNLCCLDLPALLKDGDTWAGYLYNFEERVQAVIQFPVARAVLDVNRAADDLPPQNSDGVVKTVTVDNEPIWRAPGGLTAKQVRLLLDSYYYPYHQALSVASENRQILLGLDCHTMLNRAPHHSENPGEKRPHVCLSNLGDCNGEAIEEPVSAAPGLIRAFGRLLERHLAKCYNDIPAPTVWLNRPFSGGYVTKKHGQNGQIPWIQVEINRSLYLSSEPTALVPDQATIRRTGKLNKCLSGALEELFCMQKELLNGR